jgi:parallel beta-helix repeat protein
MKTNRKSLVYVLIFLLSFTSFLGLFTSAEADEAWTDISTLPHTITESGHYRLTAAYNISGTGLSINASNVVVDGQNHLIQLTQAEDEYAITIAPGSVNVALKNINQTRSDYGVYAEEASFTAENSFFTNNTSAAVFAFNSTGFTVQHSKLSNNSNGVVAIQSSNFVVTDCHVSNNTCGVLAVSSSNFMVENSYLNNNFAAATSQGCENFTVRGSLLKENYEGIEAENCRQFNIDNSIIINNLDFALYSFNSTATVANSELSNNTAGIFALISDLAASNTSLNNNLAGMLLSQGNASLWDCELNDNVFGATFFGSNATIHDCGISNNTVGVLSENSKNLSVDSSNISSNALGLMDSYGRNTQITHSIFSKNGLTDYFVAGALLIEEANCTVTHNLFDGNSDGLLLDIYNEALNNTQTYHSNTFTNNSFTFGFNYQLPSNFTNHQIFFYNNLVNDTAYVNPDSFSQEDQYAPPSTVFHLNSTLQAGARVYVDGGRMIGGNYWAYPNGTGPSQTGTDADHDGFLDVPFDFFGNQTVYDYLPLSSDFVEYVDHLTISPDAAVITAGNSVNYTVTAYDQYGNSWNVTAALSVNGQQIQGNTVGARVPGAYYIEASYGGKTVTTVLTVTTGPLNRYVVLAPSSASTGTPFAIRVVAVDAYNNIVTSFSGTVKLNANGTTLTPSNSDAFTSGYWLGTVTIPQTGTFTITAADGDGNTGTSGTITVTAKDTTPTPTPTPPAQTVQATKEDGSKVTLQINGNITSAQMTNITLTTDPAAQTTTLSFTLTGQNGDSGFSNITLAKNTIPHGTTPIVYIDGQQAPNQGYSQDSQNYYVWFTTHFSTHQVQIIFTDEETTVQETPLAWYGLIIGVIIAAIVIVAVLSRRKH